MRAFVHRYGRACLGFGVLALAAVAMVAYSVELQQIYQHFLLWQGHNGVAFVAAFAALFILAALTSAFPASILGVAAGAAFGIAAGFALSAGALLVAALIAFLLARYFFRGVTRSIASRFFDIAQLEARLHRYGWRYGLVIRSAPLAPFGITSYGLGLTPIPLGQYLITTAGAFPFLFACVYLGSVTHFVGAGPMGGDQHLLWKISLMLTAAAAALGLAVKVLPRLVRRFIGE